MRLDFRVYPSACRILDGLLGGSRSSSKTPLITVSISRAGRRSLEWKVA